MRSLLTICLFCFATTQARARVELNSSILIFSDYDLSRCPALVQEAQALGNSRVNFVPTLNLVSDGESGTSLLCYFTEPNGNCPPYTTALVQRFEKAFTSCLRTATDQGMSISVLPHLDDAGEANIWRNDADFDPLQNYGGATYLDSVLKPLLGAMMSALQNHPELEGDLTLAGEMGTTLFQHPSSYLRVLNNLRVEARGLPIHFGLSFNYNKIAGQSRRFRSRDREAMQKLLDSSDFLGISNYATVHVPVRSEDFLDGVASLDKELKKLHLTRRDDQDFHYSEMSIGGGDYKHPGQVASDPWVAAEIPSAGVGGAYSSSNDPWRSNEMREFRRSYFRALLNHLASPQPKLHLTRAFLWNSASWDPQGLGSTAPDWRDTEIIEMIRAHNKAGD